MDFDHIQAQDPDVFAALMGEERQQAEGLELIPSENYVSRAVRENFRMFCDQFSISESFV